MDWNRTAQGKNRRGICKVADCENPSEGFLHIMVRKKVPNIQASMGPSVGNKGTTLCRQHSEELFAVLTLQVEEFLNG